MVKTITADQDMHRTQSIAAVNRLHLIVILGVLILLLSSTSRAEEVSREQIKGLDEQVQEIKSDVLAIAAELNHLEEKLLYPSNTHVAMFVSFEGGDNFLLDSLEIRLDGEAVTHHLYSYKELEAFKKGGLQRIYTGNLSNGGHELQITMLGRTKGGSDLSRSESFRIDKSIGPKAVEIRLSSPGLGEDSIQLKEL